MKVVPPKGYKARKDEYKNLNFVVPHPIEQIVNGKEGIYELINLQRESRPLCKYKKLVESFDKLTNNKEHPEVEKMVNLQFLFLTLVLEDFEVFFSIIRRRCSRKHF